MRRFVVAAFGLSFGVAGALCAPQAAAVELKVGAFLPVTGPTADVGAQIKAGIELAVERFLSQSPKIGSEPLTVRIIWYDDEAKADVALNAVNRALTVDKVHVGIGFLSSDIYVRVMEEFQKASIPVIASNAGSNKISSVIAEKKLSYVFQLSPNVNDIGGATTAAAVTLLNAKKVGLLNENTDAGRDMSQVSKEWIAANAKGVEVVADEFVARGATDLTAQMAKFKRLGVDTIIGEIYGSSGPVLYRQWYELKVPALIAHHGSTVSAQTFIDDHKAMIEGAIINNRWWPAKYTDISEPMVEAYTKKVGSAPTNHSVQAFDVALVVGDAAVQAGSVEPAKLRDAIASGTFKTAWGMRKFTSLEQGHRMPMETVVVQIQNGKKVPIYPANVAKDNNGVFQKVPPYAWDKK